MGKERSDDTNTERGDPPGACQAVRASSLLPKLFDPMIKLSAIKVGYEDQRARSSCNKNGGSIFTAADARALHGQEIGSRHSPKCRDDQEGA